MLPKNIQTLIIILVFVIFAIIGSSYLSSKLNPSSNNPTKQSDQRTFPKEVVNSQDLDRRFSVLYKLPDDTSGRSLLLQSTTLKGFHDGVGIVKSGESPDEVNYIVGSFKEFQPISGENDKLLVLTNPIEKNDLPILRLVVPEGKNSEEKNYMVWVENPSNLQDGIPKAREELYTLTSKTIGDVMKLLQKGDAVIAHPIRKNENEIEFDSRGNMLVGALTIRRFGGKTNL